MSTSQPSDVAASWAAWWKGSVAASTPAGDREKYYASTAINYTNGDPHLGHAYEAICTDVIARYHRIRGRETHFVTGTDEHGQKIAGRAEAEGVTPLEVSTKYAQKFQELNKRLLVSNDDFIRTTEERHKECAQWLLQRAIDAGDVYEKEYEGWYNVREEAFVTDKDAEAADFKDASSGQPLVKMKEDSYFFRMSAYQARLVEHIKTHPEFIQPDQARELILSRLEGEELRDLSISRTTFQWGIPFPNDAAHVMYVWFDALTNYLSAVAYHKGAESELRHLWPADVHVIGKDITWFHTVIWGSMLMSAGVPLPKAVFSHGFVTDKEGKKMSKSVGNVVDPCAVLAKYPVDSIRYYLVTLSHFGSDPPFDEEELVRCHDANLASKLGNLVVRTAKLAQSYNDGLVPDAKADTIFDVAQAVAKTDEEYKQFELKNAADYAMDLVQEVNGFLTEKEPWKHADDKPLQLAVVRSCLEAIYVVAHLLSPVIPQTAMEVFQSLNVEPVALTALSPNFDNLTPGTKLNNTFKFKPLTEREDKKSKAALSMKAAAEAKKKKKAAERKRQEAAAAAETQSPFSKLDIRVGEIVKVWKHPDSEKLYCEEIDVGLDAPLQIASGLQEHYTLEEMQNRRCLVFCNLRPAKLGGFKSHGMVLCAVADGKSEFVTPPVAAKVGERVFCEGMEGEPVTAAQVRKKKVLEAVLPDLRSDKQCVAAYQGKPILTSAGPCTVPTKANAPLQ